MEQLTFGPFRLDVGAARLHRDGAEVELRRQAFQALRVLLANCGRSVSYEQMIREAWEGTLVSRHTVAVTVGEARKALGEYGSYINHRARVGYCLEAPACEDWIRKGWFLHNRCTREGFEKALECFQRAAARDSADPRPLEGMCRMYLGLGTSGMRPAREMHRAFETVYGKAVSLAGVTPELRLNRGHSLHIFERRPAEAEAELLRARKENARRAAVDISLAMLYTAVGRLDEALTIVLDAKESDGFWTFLAPMEINLYFCRREFDRAIVYGQQALELHPYLGFARLFYAQALEFIGRSEDALAEYRRARALSPDLPWLPTLEATCMAKMGYRGEASAILQKLQKNRTTEYVDAYYMAILRDALGDRDGAFTELDRAFQENSAALPVMDVDPKMDGLRSDRRFARFRERLFLRPTPVQNKAEKVQIAAAW